MKPTHLSVEFRWLPTVLGAVLLCVGIGYVTLGVLGGRAGLPILGFGVLVAVAGVIFMRIGRGASAKWPATVLGIVLLVAGVVWVALGTVDGVRFGILIRGGVFILLAIILLRYARGAKSIPFRPAKGRPSEST